MTEKKISIKLKTSPDEKQVQNLGLQDVIRDFKDDEYLENISRFQKKEGLNQKKQVIREYINFWREKIGFYIKIIPLPIIMKVNLTSPSNYIHEDDLADNVDENDPKQLRKIIEHLIKKSKIIIATL